jgi:hypothetical protein
MDHRDADARALLTLLDAQRVEEPAQRVLGRGIGGPRRQRYPRHERAGRDDRPLRLAQVRQRLADDVDRGGERHVDGAVEVVRMHLQDVAEDGSRGVRDDDVQPAEYLDGVAHGLLGGVALAEVGLQDRRVDPLAADGLAQLLVPAGDEHEARAFGGEEADGGQAHAGARTRDQDALALELGGRGTVGRRGRHPAAVPGRKGGNPVRACADNAHKALRNFTARLAMMDP